MSKSDLSVEGNSSPLPKALSERPRNVRATRTMPEMLQEYVDSGNQPLRLDRSAAVIRGVKLLGLRSRNGRRYQERALAESIDLYEGAKVNVNHPKGHPLSPRDYQDRLGVVCGVHLRSGEGLFGDLQFNPKHALSEQLMWDAEHASQNVGLSHNVLAQTSRQGEETVVEAITKVQSIDLVADPAATQGLYEQEADDQSRPDTDRESPAVAWDSLTVEHLRLHRPDLIHELEYAQGALLEELRSRLDELAAQDAVRRRRDRIAELLRQHGLPLPGDGDGASQQIISEQFVETLLHAADEESVERLIEDRAALVQSAEQWRADRRRTSGPPVSRDQIAVVLGGRGTVRDSKEFAAAVRG